MLDQKHLLCLLQQAESELPDVTAMEVPSRTVYLPLAWEDSQTQLATERYMQTVRQMRRGVLTMLSLFVVSMV